MRSVYNKLREQGAAFSSSSRKNGLPYVTACDECQRVGCSNASEEDRHDVEEDVDNIIVFDDVEEDVDNIIVFETIFN